MSTSDAVFDVWFIPWIMPSGGPPAIFLEAKFETRLDRVCSRMNHGDKEYVAQLLGAKDARARTVAQQCYGIDIFTDRTPFEEIVATDCLSIDEVTRRICMLAEGDQRHIPEAQLLGRRSANDYWIVLGTSAAVSDRKAIFHAS
jgi:cytidylate kinase